MKDFYSFLAVILFTFLFSAFDWIIINDNSLSGNFKKIFLISLTIWASTYILYGLIMTIALKHTSPVIIFGSIWAAGILSCFKIAPYILPDQWFIFSDKAELILLMGLLYAAVMVIRKWRSLTDFINGYVIYHDRRHERP
jgi:hypothetical protein